MQLKAHSDASYLSLPKAKSYSGGHFFLSNSSTPNNTQYNYALNRPILVLCKILKFTMTSAAEAEIGAAFLVT